MGEAYWQSSAADNDIAWVEMMTTFEEEVIGILREQCGVLHRIAVAVEGRMPKLRMPRAKFAEDGTAMQLCRLLFERIQANNPQAKEPNWQGWAKDMDLILRVDGRT